MFNQDFIKKLKQSNISKDAEKTKERMYKLWQSLSKDKKGDILTLAGVSKATVSRKYKTGVISAKLDIPISQISDTDPNYLIGSTDEYGHYTYEDAVQFLTELGYTKILAEYEKEQKKIRRKEEKQAKSDNQNAESVQSSNQAGDNAEPLAENEVPQADSCSMTSVKESVAEDTPDIELTEDEMILLIKSALLRANKGIEGADIRLNKIKKLLLS